MTGTFQFENTRRDTQRIGMETAHGVYPSVKPRAFFWVAEPTSSFDQLCSFSQAVFRFESPQSQPPLDMSYGDWRMAFETLARLAEKERTMVIIDEFTTCFA